ncbi:CDF family Co(II)/Ni(II) efflux transporter DmeF [Massilia sp. 9I]|uniref:CDF family Co(II)/Ni(II) efflux transporter DmeF n=1 Tax=Massilia sp. 9I TaxID=2653152 RepID=UPI0012F460B4|nr:CDF family Co(II)/Ni(II) efflux transporter DmeF [Massilia sp. 9I]VXC49248.1 Cation diffusion facilitator family transporter [Massilia sp. 9I]
MQDLTRPHPADALAHEHIFDQGNNKAERGTRLVMWITAAMMVIEIAAGWWFNSMALLADGWHMSSHTLAIGLSAFAYAAARKYAHDPRFAFGTWKIEILAGFTSAILLLGIAALMAAGSIERIFAPEPIHYREAIVIAAIGLVVNVACALILGHAHHGHGHGHGYHGHHDHDHGHDHGHHDLNLKSAYIHVIADAATSVLAIGALAGGWAFGWSWLDPVMGIVGAVLVAVWAKNLIVETGKILLDREMDAPVVEEIREVIAAASAMGETRLADLHVWRVGQQAYACALTIATNDPSLTPVTLREQLGIHEEIVHATIEVHQLPFEKT